jgi:hypothetical protein
MEKVAADRVVRNWRRHGVGRTTGVRRSHTSNDVETFCLEAMQAPWNRTFNAAETRALAAAAYHLIGRTPWSCTAREFADALDLPADIGGTEPELILWAVADFLLAPTKACESLYDRCWLFLELAAPTVLLNLSTPLRFPPELSPWVRYLALGRRNQTGQVPAMR